MINQNTALLEDHLTSVCNKIAKSYSFSIVPSVFCYELDNKIEIEVLLDMNKEKSIKAMRKYLINDIKVYFDTIFAIKTDMLVETYLDEPVVYLNTCYSKCRLTYMIPTKLYDSLIVFIKMKTSEI